MLDFCSCFQCENPILLEGALGERLKREFGLMPHGDVAWASLVYTEMGRKALSFLWNEYLGTAKRFGLPFAATTPTRRANRERVGRSSFGESILHDNVDFLRDIQQKSGCPMFIGGLMGCRGDAYRATEVMPPDEAHAFHAWQAGLFARARVDFLFAGIMPALSEAVGIARAMGETGIPYIISFMIRENGRLIDGTAIHDAIACIDEAVDQKPLGYMTNCVHPDVLYRALSAEFNRTNLVRARLCGIQANTSPLPPEELDDAFDLKSSDAESLAFGIERLKEWIPLRIAGGCCGTDNSHIQRIAELLAKPG